jgi:hypothetical protein
MKFRNQELWGLGSGLILVLIVFLSSNIVYAQGNDALRAQLQFENFYGAKYRSSSTESKFVGSECLIDDWLPVEITFANGSAQFDQGKLNLVNSAAEVIYKEREMFISPGNYKVIKLLNQNRWFVPGSKYYYKDVSLLGLVEIYEPTPVTPYILTQHYVYIKEPSSNGYINAGSMESTRMKASNNFLHDGVKLIPIKNKSALEKFYSADKPLFTKLRKEFKTDFRDPKALHKLVKAMESSKTK